MDKNNGFRFNCNFCEKSYKHKQTLFNHKKRTHNSNKEKIKCNNCNVHFLNLRSLIRHNNEKHNKVKLNEKFNCEICKKNFNRKTNFARHLKRHVKLPREYFQLLKRHNLFKTTKHFSNTDQNLEKVNFLLKLVKKI